MTAIAVAYGILNVAYWFIMLVPKTLLWDLSHYEWEVLTYRDPDFKDFMAILEKLNPSPSCARTL